eukprot:scaffold17396_cov65-Phaeocystis_antarctica.AAC.8
MTHALLAFRLLSTSGASLGAGPLSPREGLARSSRAARRRGCAGARRSLPSTGGVIRDDCGASLCFPNRATVCSLIITADVRNVQRHAVKLSAHLPHQKYCRRIEKRTRGAPAALGRADQRRQPRFSSLPSRPSCPSRLPLRRLRLKRSRELVVHALACLVCLEHSEPPPGSAKLGCLRD